MEDEVALDEFSKFEEKLAKKQAKAKDMGSVAQILDADAFTDSSRRMEQYMSV